jgi:hypothetical protein
VLKTTKGSIVFALCKRALYSLSLFEGEINACKKEIDQECFEIELHSQRGIPQKTNYPCHGSVSAENEVAVINSMFILRRLLLLWGTSLRMPCIGCIRLCLLERTFDCLDIQAGLEAQRPQLDKRQRILRRRCISSSQP